MATLKYLLVCDHARAEAGLAHILGAGVDRVVAPSVPTATNLGLVAQLGFADAECGMVHAVRIVFRAENGDKVIEYGNEFTPMHTSDSLDRPPNWPAHVLLVVNMGVPIPDYGVYVFDLTLNEQLLGSWSIYAVPAPEDRPED